MLFFNLVLSLFLYLDGFYFWFCFKRSLKSAAEVKQWIPGIKREIDYCLDVS